MGARSGEGHLLPAGHSVHCVEFSALNVPAGHASMTVAEGQTKPGGQVMQEACAVSLAKEPSGHAVHVS